MAGAAQADASSHVVVDNEQPHSPGATRRAQQHRHADQARDAMEVVRSASFMMGRV